MTDWRTKHDMELTAADIAEMRKAAVQVQAADFLGEVTQLRMAMDVAVSLCETGSAMLVQSYLVKVLRSTPTDARQDMRPDYQRFVPQLLDTKSDQSDDLRGSNPQG